MELVGTILTEVLFQAILVGVGFAMVKRIIRQEELRRNPPSLYFGHIEAALAAKRVARTAKQIGAAHARVVAKLNEADKTG
jgi:mannose/fructose/N-acetylgalactosamine-specific phosphotransferase system component IIC